MTCLFKMFPSYETAEKWFEQHRWPEYVNEFSGRHNTRELDTIDQVQGIFLEWLGSAFAVVI